MHATKVSPLSDERPTEVGKCPACEQANAKTTFGQKEVYYATSSYEVWQQDPKWPIVYADIEEGFDHGAREIIWQCPNCGVWIDSDHIKWLVIQHVEEVWQCGKCKGLYTDKEAAGTCCD